MVKNNLVGGWALPLWKMMVFVSWDDEIPNIWKNKSHVPNHQPEDLWPHQRVAQYEIPKL